VDDLEQDQKKTEAPSRWSIFPIALSLAAFVFSIWTWYYGSIYEYQSLMAIPLQLKVPFDKEMLSGDHYQGELEMRLFLVNPGNRPAAILRVAMELWPQHESEHRSYEILCKNDSEEVLPGINAKQLRSQHTVHQTSAQIKPATPIIEPGKIVELDLRFNASFGWDEMWLNRQVETCICFKILDHTGSMQDRVFPLSSIGFWPYDSSRSAPGLKIPRGPWRLL
jgi:hypothetical protein